MKLNRLFLFPAIMVFASTSSKIYACNNSPRSVEYFGGEIDVFVSPDAPPTLISLPESDLRAAVKEKPVGLTVTPDQELNSRFSVSIEGSYQGRLFVDGQSGETYKINLLTKKGCPDTLVEVISARNQKLSKNTAIATLDPLRATLMQYLWHSFEADGLEPPGYRKLTFFDVPRERRLVYSEGALKMYYDTVYEGPRYTGHIFEIVNTGRIAYTFDYNAFDYNDERIRKILGKAIEVSMMPADQTLDPAPEFVEDIYAHNSTGFFYVVSESKK